MATALAQAHAAMHYELSALMPEEFNWLQKNGATPPAGSAVFAPTPRSVVRDTPGGAVGFVLLPRLPLGADTPPQQTVDAVVAEARALAGRTKLVVGLSPWGAVAEDAFLQNAPHVLDILLGAGPGPGIAGRFTPDGLTFWGRTYGRGKALHVIHIGQWPTRDAAWKWVKDGNLRLQFSSLTQDVPSDQDMRRMMDGLGLSF